MKINKRDLEKLVRSIVKESLDVMKEDVQVGEWWIYPGGNTDFADGNLGDSGHEGVVINYLIIDILEHFGIDVNGEIRGYLGDYEDELKTLLIDGGRLSPKEQIEWDEESPSEIILRKLLEDKVYSSEEQATDAVYIAYGSFNRQTRDARLYAMKYLHWKRAETSSSKIYIQTWTLTQQDLSDISNGISDIWEEGTDESESQNVYIEVRSNNNTYNDIPLEIIDKKNIMALSDYRVRLPWINEGIFHEHKDWIIYEGHNKITVVFEDNSRLYFEVKYPAETWGDNKDKWKHKAASKWKSIAREIYNNTGLSEVGNPIVKSWKECYKEALQNSEMKEFIKVSKDLEF